MEDSPGETGEIIPSESESVGGEAVEPRVELARPAQCRLCGMVQAEQVEVTRGGALFVLGEEVSVERGISVFTVARDLRVHQGGSQWLLAGEARVEQGGSAIMVARRVEASDLRVGVLLAGHVEGNVQALVDQSAAVRFGLAFGAALGITLLLRRLLGAR